MIKVKGEVALITGASRGIGRAIAIELSKKGAMVAINYSKDEQGALNTLDEINKNGGYGIIVKADVSDYEQCKAMVNQVVNKFGKIDILINNSGVSKVGLFMDMQAIDIDNIVDINLKGVINVTHNVINNMITRKKGNIINISSIWGLSGASCETVYSATKGGINSFTKGLAKELGTCNIRVNAVAPGVIETDMNKWLDIEERKALEDEIPLGKFGAPQDIAKIITFLCSDEAKYITGQVITVDGGLI
jgi:3-oxoacyl-[acyl-carrier protein] reductase